MDQEKISNWMHAQLILQAREFRKNPTQAEALLWAELRKRQLGELKFRRQHIIYTYIVDFFCPAAKLVVEIDGPIHINQEEYDAEREENLQALGYHIVRFTNNEVDQDLELVLDGIYDACMQRIESFRKKEM